ncbi:MAG: hypothetical protein HYS25_01055 [Ignavibacteriales bacterium]|nr:hypothetical protein [Ignavibacteriales bacterium]
MYHINEHKEERIRRLGITADLPLWNQEPSFPKVQQPDWLWSGTGIKAELYNKLKDKFAEDSFEYLNALIILGGKATDHEVKEHFNDNEKWALHIVSARRNYFTKEPFYLVTSYPGQEVIGPKGRQNTIWFLNYKNLFKLIME